MNTINTIFPCFLAYVCARATFRVLNSENVFEEYGAVVGFCSILIGIPCGVGISFLVSAGILWLVIGILSFFGVTAIGAWTVGFSLTAVKATMMIVFLINLIRKR